MANIETKEHFEDLGKFIDVTVSSLLGVYLYALKFQNGELILSDGDMNKLKEKLKWKT